MKSLSLVFVALFLASCASEGFKKSTPDRVYKLSSVSSRIVRTTAYCHKEDGVQHNAINSRLSSGTIYSAAADWSRFPVGTTFRIPSTGRTYVIDDYGAAMVGTDTIDLYVPTMREMNRWGVRRVPIDIIQMGSYKMSLVILKPRARRGYIRRMVQALETKTNTPNHTQL